MTTTTGGALGAMLRTEQRHPDSTELDTMSTIEIIQLLGREDATVAGAVAERYEEIASLVDAAAARLANGGSVHYFGAGTPGRLAVLDAAELLPTFDLEPGLVVAHMAGGDGALIRAIENAEDSEADGEAAAAGLGPSDVAIGLSASGSTPFVRGALRAAQANGALTAVVTSNVGSSLGALADIVIEVDTGPEVLTGSTRLKAGTAEKLVLNGFSTALMVRHGRTWSNLMSSVVATNAKLRDRAVRILAEAGEMSLDDARSLLTACSDELGVAIVCALSGADVDRARTALVASSRSVRDAVMALSPSSITLH